MIISSQRHLFSIPRDICYLNAAYMTPQTHAMLDAGNEGMLMRSQPWLSGEKDFFPDVEEVRSLFAKIISAKADHIAITPAASYGIAVAARNISLKKGQSILVLEEQFPSNIYSWQRMANEQELNIITVEKPNNGNWSEVILDVLEREGDNIGVLALPAYHWADGGYIDLPNISKEAKKLGAYLVLDLTQSLGAVPFSIKDVDADYVAVGAYKWLFCPYSIGFLYVAPRHQNGIPLEENWINRKGSENFARLVDYVDEYLPGARRFDMGERASFNLMPQAKASLTQLLNWGVDNIFETVVDKNKTIKSIFEKYGFKASYSNNSIANILGLEPEHKLPDGFVSSIFAQGVRLSVRGNALRIAPHVYNDAEDLDRLDMALKKTIG